MTKTHTARPVWIVLALLSAALLLSVMVGSVFIPLESLLAAIKNGLAGNPDADTFTTILFSLRLPRTILIALVGAGLASSGTAYQGLFRNPLADPYLIGVASGAGLGAVAAMSIQWSYTPLGLAAIPMSAFLGGFLTVLIVYALARVGKTVPVSTLILAGVAVSAFTSSLTSFLVLTTNGEVRRALIWLMGGATLSGWRPVIALLPYWLVGVTLLLSMGHALNVLQFGDEQAQQLGLPVTRVRRVVIIAAALTTAAAVAFAGVIGFVGLVVPHILRLFMGGDYRRLLALSLPAGAAFLLVADVLARIVLAPQELPVGIISALAGAPFFLWLLRAARRNSAWS